MCILMRCLTRSHSQIYSKQVEQLKKVSECNSCSRRTLRLLIKAHFDLHHSFPFSRRLVCATSLYRSVGATANQFAFVHLQAALVCKWKESICDTSRAARTAVPVTTGRWTQQRRSSRRSTPWQTEKGVPKSNLCLFFCRRMFPFRLPSSVALTALALTCSAVQAGHHHNVSCPVRSKWASECVSLSL